MTTQRELTVADADTAFATAEHERTALEHRIRAGAPDVTAEDLARADAAVRFAQRRRELAVEQEAARTEQARQDRIAALREDLAALAGGDAVAKAQRKLEQAIDAYLVACREHDDRHSAVYDELVRIGSLPEDLTLRPGDGQIEDGPATYRHAFPQREIDAVVSASMSRHFPQRQR